jgi:undecaprenyl-diphosphatase
MEKLLEWDHSLLHYINVLLANSWFDVFFPAITDLHKSLIFNLVAYPFFIGLFYWKFKRVGFLIFFGLLLCLGLSDISGSFIKKNVQRTRPADTTGVEVITRSPYGGYSFASNHATNMFALAMYSSSFIPPLSVPLYSMAVLVSYSRVYNGVHFPSDVLFGGLLGTLWGILISRAVKKIISRRKKPT